ncbi:TetR/AcrR family tetracycline transcriptional repressor [Kibdelosporangium banguiense]|uniref:TetR/AcrR family tetracycline transcriptional repressor n=1 Tax=Kibdelosporangium banguiense TaxID=1365924 RepID=A0ABS4TT85_9PSEU|nr:TetR/AcrR family transcriptional regulator C-terminal domain-containing protein [Kibdelosporangium banguiense]MBP2327604.1 TetR/AcrR family tetracycline transcriptional repressor [Kibdelosporangium banguiense]
MARLDIQRITDVAVELLDEVGLAELSTRRLAARLGVQSPTLYWHVKNKAELLDLVAEAICAGPATIDPALTWREQLTISLRRFRDLLLSHRDAAALLRERPPIGPRRLGHLEATLRILRHAGFAEAEAAGIARLLTAHVLDSTQDPQAPDQFDADQFSLGLEIILDGLELRLTRAAPSRPASPS